MDVLFHVVIAGQPREVVPVAKLPFHVAPSVLADAKPQSSDVIVALQGGDLADPTVMDPSHHLPHRRAVPQHQTRDNRQTLFAGCFAGCHHRANAGSIDCHRLFSKHVFSSLDGRL